MRVQCKTGRLRKGAVVFYPCSVDSRSEPGRCLRRAYAGDVDLFGVYCPDNRKCYLSARRGRALRGQLLAPDGTAQERAESPHPLGTDVRDKGGVELAGFEPATS